MMSNSRIHVSHNITKYRQSCKVSEVSSKIGLNSLVIIIKSMITIQWNMIEFSTHLTLWLFHGITTKILEMKPWHSFATKMSRLIGEILIRASITTTLSKITRVDYWTLISVWWVTRITMRVVLIWLLIFFFFAKIVQDICHIFLNERDLIYWS